MAAAAARTADGVIGHGLFTARWWDEVVRPAVERGQAQSERDAAALEHGWLITAIDDDDPERAVKDARRMVGFYLTVKTYDTFAEHHGWTAQVEELRARSEEHTSELQSLMRISYAVFCLKKKNIYNKHKI